MKPRDRAPFSSRPPRILSIAGSDPSGGAGIQADLKTIAALGCYGMSVVTSLTAQNTRGVQSIHTPPADFCRAQLQALWSDIDIDGIKIGMLATSEVVSAVAQELEARKASAIMVSTTGSMLLTEVSISQLIDRLLPICTVLTPNLPEAQQLLRHARKGAPDVALSHSDPVDRAPLSLAGLLECAKNLTELGPQATLVKGGHQILSRRGLIKDLDTIGVSMEAASAGESELPGTETARGKWQQANITLIRSDLEPYSTILQDEIAAHNFHTEDSSDSDDIVVDVLYERQGESFTVFVKRHVQSSATHGTGCTLSSAIATFLGASQAHRGASVRYCVHQAITYVQSAISRGIADLGNGAGPLNHLCSIAPRGVMGRALASQNGAERNPLCARLIAHSIPLWRAFTRHPFLEQLAHATLPRESFIYFLQQDYIFLKHYARVWASGASSYTTGSTFEEIGFFAGLAAEMVSEAANHVEICESVWGLSRHTLEHETTESAATLAYTRFVLDVSRSGDALDLLVATAPCLLGYAEAGRWAASKMAEKKKRAENHDMKSTMDGYDQWVKYYAGEHFQNTVYKGVQTIEEYATHQAPSPVRLASLQRTWNA